MKRILLTSTALIGFAGYAAAEVTWAADAELGYNEEVEGGFYFDGGLGVIATADLGSGIEAGLSLDVDLNFLDADTGNDNDAQQSAFGGIDVGASDLVIFVTSDIASLYVGDTETASQQIWMGTTNMETDGFLEEGDVDDGVDEGDFVDGVLRTDLSFGSVSMSVSYFLVSEERPGDDLNGLDGLQVGASADLGSFTVGIVYQEEVDVPINALDTSVDAGVDGIVGTGDDVETVNNPGTVDEVIGVFAKTSFGGADVTLAYSSNETTDASSTGVEVSYPVGPVTATVFYSFEDGAGDTDVDDNYGLALAYANGPIAVTAYYHDGTDEEFGLEASYDAGNGLMVYAGYIDNRDDIDENTETYIAAEYGLNDSATIFASYGEAGDGYTGDLDEIGNSFEVNEGATIGVSFEF